MKSLQRHARLLGVLVVAIAGLTACESATPKSWPKKKT